MSANRDYDFGRNLLVGHELSVAGEAFSKMHTPNSRWRLMSGEKSYVGNRDPTPEWVVHALQNDRPSQTTTATNEARATQEEKFRAHALALFCMMMLEDTSWTRGVRNLPNCVIIDINHEDATSEKRLTREELDIAYRDRLVFYHFSQDVNVWAISIVDRTRHNSDKELAETVLAYSKEAADSLSNSVENALQMLKMERSSSKRTVLQIAEEGTSSSSSDETSLKASTELMRKVIARIEKRIPSAPHEAKVPSASMEDMLQKQAGLAVYGLLQRYWAHTRAEMHFVTAALVVTLALTERVPDFKKQLLLSSVSSSSSAVVAFNASAPFLDNMLRGMRENIAATLETIIAHAPLNYQHASSARMRVVRAAHELRDLRGWWDETNRMLSDKEAGYGFRRMLLAQLVRNMLVMLRNVVGYNSNRQFKQGEMIKLLGAVPRNAFDLAISLEPLWHIDAGMLLGGSTLLPPDGSNASPLFSLVDARVALVVDVVAIVTTDEYDNFIDVDCMQAAFELDMRAIRFLKAAQVTRDKLLNVYATLQSGQSIQARDVVARLVQASRVRAHLRFARATGIEDGWVRLAHRVVQEQAQKLREASKQAEKEFNDFKSHNWFSFLSRRRLQSSATADDDDDDDEQVAVAAMWIADRCRRIERKVEGANERLGWVGAGEIFKWMRPFVIPHAQFSENMSTLQNVVLSRDRWKSIDTNADPAIMKERAVDGMREIDGIVPELRKFKPMHHALTAYWKTMTDGMKSPPQPNWVSEQRTSLSREAHQQRFEGLEVYDVAPYAIEYREHVAALFVGSGWERRGRDMTVVAQAFNWEFYAQWVQKVEAAGGDVDGETKKKLQGLARDITRDFVDKHFLPPQQYNTQLCTRIREWTNSTTLMNLFFYNVDFARNVVLDYMKAIESDTDGKPPERTIDNEAMLEYENIRQPRRSRFSSGKEEGVLITDDSVATLALLWVLFVFRVAITEVAIRPLNAMDRRKQQMLAGLAKANPCWLMAKPSTEQGMYPQKETYDKIVDTTKNALAELRFLATTTSR